MSARKYKNEAELMQSATDKVQLMTERLQSATDKVQLMTERLQSVTDKVQLMTGALQGVTGGLQRVTGALQGVTGMGWLSDPDEECVFVYMPDLRTVLYEAPDAQLPVPEFAIAFQLTVEELVAGLYE